MILKLGMQHPGLKLFGNLGFSIRLNHNQGSTDIFAMLQTLNLGLTPFIVAIMMLNHAATPPVSVI